LLKAHDLIASPAFIVVKAVDEFKDKTTACLRSRSSIAAVLIAHRTVLPRLDIVKSTTIRLKS
jgi:hypothetical protein